MRFVAVRTRVLSTWCKCRDTSGLTSPLPNRGSAGGLFLISNCSGPSDKTRCRAPTSAEGRASRGWQLSSVDAQVFPLKTDVPSPCAIEFGRPSCPRARHRVLSHSFRLKKETMTVEARSFRIGQAGCQSTIYKASNSVGGRTGPCFRLGRIPENGRTHAVLLLRLSPAYRSPQVDGGVAGSSPAFLFRGRLPLFKALPAVDSDNRSLSGSSRLQRATVIAPSQPPDR